MQGTRSRLCSIRSVSWKGYIDDLFPVAGSILKKLLQHILNTSPHTSSIRTTAIMLFNIILLVTLLSTESQGAAVTRATSHWKGFSNLKTLFVL